MGARRAYQGPSFSGLTVAAILAALASRGCSYAWDTYDPRLTGSSSSGGGNGGAPSSSSSSSSSSSGTGGASSSSSSSGTGGAGGASSSSSSGTGGASSSSSSGTGGTGGAMSSSSSSSSSSSGICTPSFSQPCYDGPAGTQNNPPCMAGIQICASDGLSWGPCLTQVLPISEDCGTTTDDDCSGTANDHCATWSKCFGDTLAQKPRALAVNASGRVVLAGQLFGGVDFGGGVITSMGTVGDVFVAALNESGGHVWSRVYGDAAAVQVAYGVAVDAAGNVVITGEYAGTLSFGAAAGLTLTSAGGSDIFVAKLDAGGNPLWARSFGSTGSDQGNGVAFDGAGNVYVAAQFQGTVDFGMGPKTASSSNGVLLKLDPNGATTWSFTFGGSSSDSADSVAVDSMGNPVITGLFTTTATFGATMLTGQGLGDIFVAKLDATGTPLWAKAFGSVTAEAPGAIAVDPGDNVLVDGFYGGSIDAGCGALPSLGPANLFVAKLTASGQCAWSRGYANATDGSQDARITTDGAGNVFVIDEFVGDTDFGGGLVSVANPHDVLLLSLDPSGNFRYSRRFGDGSDQDGRGVGVDGTGNVYVVAELSAGKIDFGNGPLTDKGSDDVCVARIAP